MEMSHWTRKRIPCTVKLLADCCLCVCVCMCTFYFKQCVSLLHHFCYSLSIFLVSHPFTLLCWPFIYTCQEVAIKPKKSAPKFYYKTICIPERKINPTSLSTALEERFGDLFRLITLTARQPLKQSCGWKITQAFFCLPCLLSFLIQGLFSQC